MIKALLDKVAAYVRKEFGPLVGPGIVMPEANFSGWDYGLPRGGTPAMAFSAVYACARILADDVAKVPIVCYQVAEDESRTPAKRHPVYRLMKKPNRFMTGFHWRQHLILSLLFHGNAYYLIRRLSNTWPVELVPIAPYKVQVYQDQEDGELFYRVSGTPGYGEYIPGYDVLHVRGLSMDGIYGVSPIRAAANATELGLALERHGSNLFARGARPGGVLKTARKLNPDTRARIRAQIEQFLGGQKSGSIAVLEEDMNFEQLTMTSTDAEFIANRKFQVEEVCRIFGVPPHRIGDMTKATYNNAQQVAHEYVNNTLASYFVNIEEQLDEQLLGGGEGFTCQFDTSELLRVDYEARMKGYQVGILHGIYSPNEARRMEGLAPYDGGERYFVPSNTVPIELAGQAQMPAPEPEPEPEKEEEAA